MIFFNYKPQSTKTYTSIEGTDNFKDSTCGCKCVQQEIG